MKFSVLCQRTHGFAAVLLPKIRRNPCYMKEEYMEQAKIDRINQLARKAKAQGLTPAEEAERAALRREYVAAVRASLTAQLDGIRIQEPDGTRHKLPKK